MPKSLTEKFFFSRHWFADVISVHNGNMKHARNLVPRSQSSVRECRNVRSGKVRYNAISGWLPELRMPHSNLLCDWLFPSVFGFCSVRGRNINTEKFSLRLRLSCDVLIHTYPLCGKRTVRNCFFGRQHRLKPKRVCSNVQTALPNYTSFQHDGYKLAYFWA